MSEYVSKFAARAKAARLGPVDWDLDDPDVTELLAGDEKTCEVCGRPSMSTWCRRCERDDLR